MLTYSSDEPTYYSLSSMLYNEETSSLSASSVNEDTLMLLILPMMMSLLIMNASRSRLASINRQINNFWLLPDKVEDVIVIKTVALDQSQTKYKWTTLAPLNLLQILWT
ncbi:unnamed protein product [Rhizophagus irregularis]|nr:unnamed protein product [Rhizophagus irregularis]CAB5383901.1 unnamed protein product [Rhizophagus irregularis]